MTRAFNVLMKFAAAVANSEDPAVPAEVKQGASAAMASAAQLRSENAIVFIGTESDPVTSETVATMYFGSQDAVRAWVKLAKVNPRSYSTEDLLY